MLISKNQSISGSIYAIFAEAVFSITSLLTLMITARYLSPEEYGVYSITYVIITFVTIFTEFGMSASAIANKDITEKDQSNLFWLNSLTGFIILILLQLNSENIAQYFDIDPLNDLVKVISIIFLLNGMTLQHGANLSRGLEFKVKAQIKITTSLVIFISVILLVINGFSYWSFVYGSILGALLNMCITITKSKLRIYAPKKILKSERFIKFGFGITGFNFLNYFSRNLDKILIAKNLGVDSLGLYTGAYRIVMFPIACLRTPLESVAFPLLSKVDATSKDFRKIYINFLTTLSMINAPVMCVFFLCAKDIIYIGFGKNWSEMYDILILLVLVGFIQPMGSLRGLILLSSGDSKRYFYSGLITTVIVSTVFLSTVNHGLETMIICYIICEWLLAMVMHIYAVKNTSIKKSDLINVIYYDLIILVLLIIGWDYIETLFYFISNYYIQLLIKMLFIFAIFLLLNLLNMKRRVFLNKLLIYIRG